MRYDPATLDEYNRRSHMHQRIDGVGLDGMTIHMPCPFCASPGFCQYKLLDMHGELLKQHTCQVCERAARMVTVRISGSVTMHFVQTAGEAPPPYIAHVFLRAPDDKAERWMAYFEYLIALRVMNITGDVPTVAGGVWEVTEQDRKRYGLPKWEGDLFGLRCV